MQGGDHPLVYVSYAWRSRTPHGPADGACEEPDREAIVDELCGVLAEEEQIVVGRDKQLVKTGDSIVDFAKDIARGGLILAVISHKSLRSDWCMVHELLQAFRRRNFEAEEFGSDVLALVLDDALEDVRDHGGLVRHWSARYEAELEIMKIADPDRAGSPESWEAVNQLRDLRKWLPDLIRALRIRAMPRGAEAIREKGFRAIRKRVLQRLRDKGLADRLSPSRLPPPPRLRHQPRARGAGLLVFASATMPRVRPPARSVPQPAPDRQEVFISYTRVDREWVDRLQQMMKPLLRAGGQQVSLWDDSQIPPGAKWRSEIEAALARAKVALLLVSDAFLASEFVMNEEVPNLLAAAEAEGVRVLWVSLSPCLVEHTPIHAYQAVLPLDHYLEELAKPQQQRALKTIAEHIREALLAPGPTSVGAPPPEPPEPEMPPPQPRTSSALPQLARQTLRLKRARLLRVGTSWELQRQPLLRVEGALEELAPGVTLPLVWIPAGEFVMGSPADELGRGNDEGPQHRVRLKAFWMGQTPITQAQWLAVMVGNPSGFSEQPDSDQRPVERVSWHEAMAYCRRLNSRQGAGAGRLYTLPSEAQWEYACRAGTTTPFAFGETLTPELANYNGNYTYANGPKGKYREQTTPVGIFPANAWGLNDMHGNVWEWCLDDWHESYAGAPEDGSAWLIRETRLERRKEEGSRRNGKESGVEGKETGARRLLRGGSWSHDPGGCRSAYRGLYAPDDAGLSVGFRVVCLPQGPSINT